MSSCSVLRVLLLFFIVSDSFVQILSAGVGINYGQIANNLPSHSRVATLLRSLNISRVKLYDADPNVLLAFANSNVEFIVGLNENLQNMADPIKAQSWVEQRVLPHLPQITCILVGNEVLNSNDTQMMANLLPAMKAVHQAVVSLGVDKQVTITTAHSLYILGNSYPPSAGIFKQNLAEYIQPLLDFQAQIKSPFLINAYPFFAYKDSPNEVPLEYVLFQPNQGTTDTNTNLHYDNMLYAQIDAVYAAIKAMGHTDIEVRISETGWPSRGDEDEVGATTENAELYNSNLLQRIAAKQGTPGRPSTPIDIYVFALFNENLKPGPASERNYGLYYPDGTPVYNIGIQGYLPGMVSASNKNAALSIFVFLVYLMAYLIFS